MRRLVLILFLSLVCLFGCTKSVINVVCSEQNPTGTSKSTMAFEIPQNDDAKVETPIQVTGQGTTSGPQQTGTGSSK